MIQLSFQPAFDPYHAIFRILRLRSILPSDDHAHIDRVRILDFLLAFPFRLEFVRVFPKHRRLRNLAVKESGAIPYGEQPDDQTVLGRMKIMQTAALETLASAGFIDQGKLEIGQVLFTDRPLPVELESRVEDTNKKHSHLIEFLTVLSREYELLGLDGLKARTKLMEYRYDAA